MQLEVLSTVAVGAEACTLKALLGRVTEVLGTPDGHECFPESE